MSDRRTPRGTQREEAPEPTTQFLRDMAAYLVRQANLSAPPYWEGIELSFRAAQSRNEEGDGLRLTARPLEGPGGPIASRVFSLTELQDTRQLAATVDEWVRTLPVADR